MDYIIKDEHGIVTFTINREQKHNAINHAVMNGLREAIDYVKAHEELKLFVITGQGEKSFCSGGDLQEFHSLKTESQAYEMLIKMGELLYEVATLPVPTLALVNGTAVGGGCEIATACDFRLVSSSSKVGFIQGSLAITTGWGGSTFLMERGMKVDDALKMLVEATPIQASQVKNNGWATELYSGDKEVALEEFIERIQLVHSSVHKAYKKILVERWEAFDMHDRLVKEIRSCAVLWEQDAHHEAVERFLNRKVNKHK